MLPSRVFVPQPSNPTQEDIFSSSISNLFTDDTQNSHGVPGQGVVYQSPRFGNVTLAIPQHPDVEEGRKLFAHYLWNAGVVAADAIETASTERDQDITNIEQEDGKVRWNSKYWDVRGKDVVELGAGTALPSIIAALAGARSITVTDHPSSPAIVNGTISHNTRENLKLDTESAPIPNQPSRAPSLSSLSIAGLTWGDPFFTSASEYGKVAQPQPAKHSFDKVIIADCLWMPSQHRNIVKTIHMWLRDTDQEPNHESLTLQYPCALVIAGYHTGRSTVGTFFEIATGRGENVESEEMSTDLNAAEGKDIKSENRGATLSIAEIFEVDVNLNVREWRVERSEESRDEAKRWCVCAVLVRSK